MPTLYLIEQNSILRKTSDRIQVCKRPQYGKKSGYVSQEEILLEIPCTDIDQVMLFGNIQVTTQALQELLSHNIELALFTYSGKLLGQITPPQARNIPLRIAQFHKYDDPDFCLVFSKTIVSSKIASIWNLLQNHQANHPGIFTRAEMKDFNKFLDLVPQATSLETLRGYEGSASAAYFKLLGRMISPPWKFDTRSRRPPADPVNAVLSYGYVIVGAEIQGLLDGIGFDPYLGFYHQVRYGRPGLALDLVEEFRHLFVDRLMLNLFNLHFLTEADFRPGPRGGIFLSETGKKKFFQHYEKMMGQFADETTPANEPKGFRQQFQRRTGALMKTILHDEPFLPLNTKN
ncbi:CRISPR-associated endonuclease Cas1 [candidate division KSB1 bacterium]|nr:CRISPR-associated endonuclease Cas1 [candidate division KSB1 bacterium]